MVISSNSQLNYRNGEVTIGPLLLTSGETLKKVTLTYELVGTSDAPVILVCHALTGNHLAVGTDANPGWWDGLIGKNQYINTNQYQVLTFNVLGGCDGSTGPTSIHPLTNESYRNNFPMITIRDMVHAQYLAMKRLHIQHVDTIIGGSLGGMQVMEWGLLYPFFMEKMIILAASPTFSDYGIAFNHIAETAIRQDPDWNGGNYTAGHALKGLELARMIGMVTYRSDALFAERFNRMKKNETYEVASYLNYQGEKLASRFDPNSYLCLLQAMNTHDIGQDRGGWKAASQLFQRPILAISYANDLIYKPDTIQTFSEITPNTTYHHIDTIFGHDGFLTEFEKWGQILTDFLEK